MPYTSAEVTLSLTWNLGSAVVSVAIRMSSRPSSGAPLRAAGNVTEKRSPGGALAVGEAARPSRPAARKCRRIRRGYREPGGSSSRRAGWAAVLDGANWNRRRARSVTVSAGLCATLVAGSVQQPQISSHGEPQNRLLAPDPRRAHRAHRSSLGLPRPGPGGPAP